LLQRDEHLGRAGARTISPVRRRNANPLGCTSSRRSSISERPIQSLEDLDTELPALYKRHDEVMRSARFFGGALVATLPFLLVLNLLERDFAGFVETWLLGPAAVLWLFPAVGVVYRAFQASRLRSRIDDAIASADHTTLPRSDAGAP